DVALVTALPGWTVHVPGHADEAEAQLRRALAGDGRIYLRLSEETNSEPVSANGLAVVRRGTSSAPFLLSVGPTLDPVLEATEDRDVRGGYLSTGRPLAPRGRGAAVRGTDVVLVEPYLAGTSSAAVTEALSDRPHRLLALGVRDPELRRYGSGAQH